MRPVVALAKKERGRVRLRQAERFASKLRTLKDGEYLVTVEPKRSARSSAQNAYWWSVCVARVSEHTGYTPDEVHELAKAMFLPKGSASAFGNGIVLGHYVIGGSTRKLSRNAFYEFVERYRQYWAEHGCPIEDPDPEYWKNARHVGRS